MAIGGRLSSFVRSCRGGLASRGPCSSPSGGHRTSVHGGADNAHQHDTHKVVLWQQCSPQAGATGCCFNDGRYGLAFAKVLQD